ncbi:MAG: class I SAM-dependent methyltransferase [Saprospiraceae bacterium]|nr:class I SAM-dependent methyltransferase [Candidatus Vicinibacter affinis]MBK7800341.1 class I SAM-dependent methyltransferase [Candidatus Vicinibacter affinis]
MNIHSVFDQNATEYDHWFDLNFEMYQSEILALKQAIPSNKKGIEIGVGTGRFAEPLKIRHGVEPSDGMATLAKKRNVEVYKGVAENLPIGDQSFDFVTMVTTDCFLENTAKAFSEVHRILKPQGIFIIGLIDRLSELGKSYEQKKLKNKFYKDAKFYSTEELTEFLKNAGFNNFNYWQTLFHPEENKIEEPQASFGKGGFVVIKAIKI